MSLSSKRLLKRLCKTSTVVSLVCSMYLYLHFPLVEECIMSLICTLGYINRQFGCKKRSPTSQKNYTNNRQLCTQKKTYTTFRVACTMYSHYSFRWFTLKNLKGATRFIAQQSFRPLNGSHFFRDGSSLLLYPITTSRILQLDTTYVIPPWYTHTSIADRYIFYLQTEIQYVAE